MMSELREVTLEARQLLRHVGAIGKEGNFLEHAFIVAGDRQPSFLNPIKERGARYTSAPLWKAHVEVSGRLVTGQNPASTKGVAEGVIKLLRG